MKHRLYGSAEPTLLAFTRYPHTDVHFVKQPSFRAAHTRHTVGVFTLVSALLMRILQISKIDSHLLR